MNFPLLSSRFFTNYSPSPEFWMKWSSIENWSVKAAPLYEWDGILYVGLDSEQVPKEFSVACVYVLCETEALSAFYQKLQKLSGTPKIPTATRVDIDPFASLGKSMGLGTDENKTVFNIDVSDLTQAETELQALEKKLKSDEPDILDLTVSDSPPLPPIPSENTGTSIHILPKKTVTTTPAASSEFTKTKKNPPPVSTAFLDKIFDQMKNHYTKSMVLRREGNAMRPWKWDSNFHPKNTTTDSLISLGTPSPFRIASRTLKPYHGYVVSNEVNEKFFDEWNQTQIPDHLTVMPIIHDEQMVAMLVGFAEKSVNQKASLALVEKITEELEKTIDKNPEALAS